MNFRYVQNRLIRKVSVSRTTTPRAWMEKTGTNNNDFVRAYSTECPAGLLP